MSLTTAEQLRACHVRRWHIVQTSREQTLAEHSFAVSVIAGSLAAKMRWRGLLHPDKKADLLLWALRHDLIEVLTGDVPTPFKKVLRKVGGEDVFDKAEDEVDKDFGASYRQIAGTEIEMIVKIADMIESIYFLQDNGVGPHAKSVLTLLREDLSRMVDKYDGEWTELTVRAATREVCREIGADGGWL